MKRHYDKAAKKWFIYIHHQIQQKDGSFLPRIMWVTMADARETLVFIRGMVMQIDSILEDPVGRIWPRLDNPKAALTDCHDPQFWDPEITDKTSSGALEMRPFITSTGKYQIRIMGRAKPNNIIPGRKCLGLTFPMSRDTAVWFCLNLEKLWDQVVEDEYENMLSIL